MSAVAPQVSIVVPLYNGAKALRPTLDSVLGQSVCDWELLVIDDGSDDDSVAIVESYRRPGIRVLHHPDRANRGQFAARLLGAEHARASVIALLDADDIWPPRYLECMMAAWLEEPCGMLFSPTVYWYPDEPSRDHEQQAPPGEPGVQRSRVLVADYLATGYLTTPCPSGSFVSRSLLLETQPMAAVARGNLYEDQCLWLYAAARAPVRRLVSQGVLYRQSPLSFSRSVPTRFAELPAVHERAALESVRNMLGKANATETSRAIGMMLDEHLRTTTRRRLVAQATRAAVRRVTPRRIWQPLRDHYIRGRSSHRW